MYFWQEGSFHAEDKLMFAQVPILKESSCQKPYGRAEFSRQTMVCAGYLQGLIDSCQARSIERRVSESLQNSYFCRNFPSLSVHCIVASALKSLLEI